MYEQLENFGRDGKFIKRHVKQKREGKKTNTKKKNKKTMVSEMKNSANVTGAAAAWAELRSDIKLEDGATESIHIEAVKQ